MTNLTEEEIHDPLFISGAITKDDKKYSLDIVKFQEYMTKKHTVKIVNETFFKYNKNCYEHMTENVLNQICQTELGGHRNLFKQNALKEFIHFAVGQALIESSKANEDQVNYLTLKNGLYDLNNEKIIQHTPDIFTTNLLPYDYNPKAECPRFLQYLDEIFIKNQEVIDFCQEAIGYVFHKSIPKPIIIFLVGVGSNGKSVFLNTLANLFGEKKHQ